MMDELSLKNPEIIEGILTALRNSNDMYFYMEFTKSGRFRITRGYEFFWIENVSERSISLCIRNKGTLYSISRLGELL